MNLRWNISTLLFLFFLLLFVTCGKFHTQTEMIYLAPGDNHTALEIEN